MTDTMIDPHGHAQTGDLYDSWCRGCEGTETFMFTTTDYGVAFTCMSCGYSFGRFLTGDRFEDALY